MALVETVENAGSNIRVHSSRSGVVKPIGGWPKTWIDSVHEEEGGDDAFGGRIQSGIEMMQKSMNALYSKNGNLEAWDDMNGVHLDVDKVHAARAEEMAFSRK